MTRTILALLFLACVVGSVSADCKGDLSKLIPLAVQLFADASAGNTAQFEKDLTNDIPALEAVAKSCKGITPTSQCNTDIANVVPYTNNIINDIAADNTAQLQKDCAKAAPYFDTAIAQCTGFQISQQCSEDLLLLIGPGAKVVDDIRTDNTKTLQSDIVAFLPQARNAIGECTGHQIDGTCQAQINLLVPDLVTIIDDLLSGNYAALIAAIQSAIPQINLTIQECLGHTPSATCQGDLIGLLPVGLAVFSDIEDKNWTQLQKDIEAAQPQIDAAWEACVGGSSYSNLGDDCYNDVVALVPYVKSAYMSLKTNETYQIIVLAQDNKDKMENALAACQ